MDKYAIQRHVCMPFLSELHLCFMLVVVVVVCMCVCARARVCVCVWLLVVVDTQIRMYAMRRHECMPFLSKLQLCLC